jgi:hypothetical protein
LRTNASAAALALFFCSWCAPGIASSGLDALCDEAGFSIPENDVPVKASLASHTDEAIDDPLKQESARLSALGAANAEHSEDTFDEAEETPEQLQSSDAPTVTTRLPGVSDSASSGFRRQMLRTDI